MPWTPQMIYLQRHCNKQKPYFQFRRTTTTLSLALGQFRIRPQSTTPISTIELLNHLPRDSASSMADESQSQPPIEVDSAPPPPPPPFDPSRMIGIIKRKALIKELAGAYHAECLVYCQELLELQRKWDEPYIELKVPDDPRKETMKPSKRQKKAR